MPDEKMLDIQQDVKLHDVTMPQAKTKDVEMQDDNEISDTRFVRA